MKYTILLTIFTLLVVGCASPEAEKTPTQVGSPSATTPTSEKGMPANAVALGTEAEADHFTVVLTSEKSDVTEGKNKFLAKVAHHGSVSEDAKVTLSLSMPDHGMDGPSIELKHTSGGMYEGEAELSMGGEWLAKVTITGAEGHSGEAAYKVVAMQK
jgi:hypothetical protein